MKKSARFIFSSIATAIAVLSLATAVSAHDTWLFPRRTDVPVGTNLILDLTSGMAFPRNETAIDPARIEEANVRLAGKTFTMTRRIKGSKSLALAAVLADRGIATIWITLKPRTLDLTPAQVHEYLDEIGAPDSIRAMYAGGKHPRWREEYSKQAKSFVMVGNPPDADGSWRIPVGTSFEIVPVTDPRKIFAGDTAAFRILRNGAGVAAFPVGSTAQSKKTVRLDRTDSQGIVRIVAPKTPGRWMLRSTDLRRPPPTTNADWESVFTTLTLNVRPKNK